MKILKNKIFFRDLGWSIAALAIMNIVLQLVLYPILHRAFGSEQYGQILFLIGIINVVAVSFGSAANSGRLVERVKHNTYNSDSLLWLLIALVVTMPLCIVASILYVHDTGAGHTVLLWIVMNATCWRYYADVEFRLTTNYKGYFLYYTFVSVGYFLGIIIFKATGWWELILLPGEIAGLLFVMRCGTIFRMDGRLEKARTEAFLKTCLNLFVAQLLTNIVLNSDRIILRNMVGGHAVTVYYVSSLIGKTLALLTTPLNSVIIGHLSKSKAKLSEKKFIKMTIIGLVGVAIVLGLCHLGSILFVNIVYPSEYNEAKGLFLMANLAQIFFFASGVVTTVLLRFIKTKYQVLINVGYVLAVVSITIFATWMKGLYGFAVGLLAANALRYILAACIGYFEIKKENKAIVEGPQIK